MVSIHTALSRRSIGGLRLSGRGGSHFFSEPVWEHDSVRRSRAEIVGIIAAWSVAVAIVLVAALVFVPPIWSAASTTVIEADTELSLVEGDASARIPVPAGWWARPAFADGSAMTIGSPDGVMTLALRLTTTTDAEDAMVRAAPGALETVDSEPLGGATLLHARTLTGDALVGAVAEGDAVLTFVSTPTPAYDAQLAQLLAAVTVTP